jgi:hypothetical protein
MLDWENLLVKQCNVHCCEDRFIATASGQSQKTCLPALGSRNHGICGFLNVSGKFGTNHH